MSAYTIGVTVQRPFGDTVIATRDSLAERGFGVLTEIEGLEQVRSHPDCERVLMFAKLGKRYRPYPDFDGFLAIVFAIVQSIL